MSAHDSSSSFYFPITPSDSTVLKGIRALYVGGAGNLVAEGLDGVQATFIVTQGGATLFIRAQKVLLTGTTATGIIGLR